MPDQSDRLRQPPMTIPAGLKVKRYGHGWWIAHVESGLPLHGVPYNTRRDAELGAAGLDRLGVDWTGDQATVQAACAQLDGGLTAVRRLATPPHELARLQRVAENSTRYLRALGEAGETVVSKTSHGLAGTVYAMSCGCQRHFTVTIGGVPAGAAQEDLLVRCERHHDLAIEES